MGDVEYVVCIGKYDTITSGEAEALCVYVTISVFEYGGDDGVPDGYGNGVKDIINKLININICQFFNNFILKTFYISYKYMVFSVTSAYTLTGDATKTLNNLTNTAVTGSTNLSDLSKVNYSNTSTDPNDSQPNADNQLIFMNQPLSWWLASLNSGAVKYTPYSNNVNWAYLDSEMNTYHINITISNLLIPNKTQSVSRVSGSMVSEITFEPKFGLSRVDKHTM